MGRSEALRLSVLEVAVKPLLCFLDLFEQYVTGGWREHDFAARVQQGVAKHRMSLYAFGVGAGDCYLVSHLLAELEVSLAERGARAQGWTGLPAKPHDIVLALRHLATVIEAHTTSTHYLGWAVIAPLAIYWSLLASDALESQPPGQSFGELLENWLGNVPIPESLMGLSAQALSDDLARLAGIVFTTPSVRDTVATRMLEAYAQRVDYDLKSVLQRAGYLTAARMECEDV